jgi:MOSC domain-containing protein YiiM
LKGKEGKVVSINASKDKGTKKVPVQKGDFIQNYGLAGDAHAGNWHRQVSLLATESVRKLEEKGLSGLPFGSFGENITTEGIILHELPVGTELKIGQSVQEITQIGKECHNGCEIEKQVGQCIMPTEGIFTQVIKSGKIKVGDKITIIK